MLKKMIATLLILTICVGYSMPTHAIGDMGTPGQTSTVSLSVGFSAAIAENGDLYTWGENEYGQLGHDKSADGQWGSPYTSTPTKVPGLSGVVAVSLGFSHGAALTASGEVYTWGRNDSGKLGYGEASSSVGSSNQAGSEPKKVPGLPKVVAISMGAHHSAAVTADGDLYTWGDNMFGQLGYKSNTFRGADGQTAGMPYTATPTKVPGLKDVVAVSLGFAHSAALTSNGEVYTWGRNDFGQLGYGSKDFDQYGGAISTTPSKVPGLKNVAAITMGYAFSAAITTSGDLYTWGNNYSGQLGNKSTEKDSFGRPFTTKPTKVPGLGKIISVSLGATHSAAVTANGDVYTWGDNWLGKLGYLSDGLDDAGYPNTAVPTKVPVIKNAISVSLGYEHGAALTAGGELYTWGVNMYGQLGDGGTTTLVSPTRVIDGIMLPGRMPLVSDMMLMPTNAIANPTGSTVYVGDTPVEFEAYLINGSNYFKLRDLAFAVSGTDKQFAVGWDDSARAVTLTSGKPHGSTGGEMLSGDGTAKNATLNRNIAITKDGQPVEIMAYLIGGSNFVKLRDIMGLFNIGITYDDATRSIRIDAS